MTITGTSGSSTNTTTLSLQVTVPGQAGVIKHVVVIVQENRTPDNMFQDSNLIANGADIQNYGYAGTTKVTLQPVSLITTYDLDHGHNAFLDVCDYNSSTGTCAMDGAYKIACSPAPCPTDPQYQYVQLSGTGYSLQPYWTMAETYTFGDRMFQTNEGPSFPAHQYILSGTSAVCTPGGSCPSGTTNTYFASENPTNSNRSNGEPYAGCLAPPAALLDTIDTSQPFPNSNYTQITGTLSECFEHPTLTDVLDSAGFTWKYYTPTSETIWTAPVAINHMCVPYSADGDYDDTVCNGTDWTNSNPNMVIEGTGAQIVTDIGNCALANVTWVIPDGAASDHADSNKGLGPSWVASIVNAIGTNPACPQTNEVYWNDTAIIVIWDDWGGWYDHVAPPLHDTNSYEYGLRVPLIVISPYAKPAYVSHQYNDFGSILKFIEETFSLPEIDPAVGYADSYALGDLSDCFNFNQSPLTFTPIPALKDARFFQNRKDAPTPPDND